MIKLDDDLLQELGLASLPAEEKKKLLAHIYETLEMRVGMKLAEQMSDAQLTEFEQFIDRNDEAGALKWLETNFPNYKDVVASEFERLKSEIKQVVPQILASVSNSQSQPGVQQQQPLPTQQPQAPVWPNSSQPMSQPPAKEPWAGNSTPPPPPPPPAGGKDDYDLAA